MYFIFFSILLPNKGEAQRKKSKQRQEVKTEMKLLQKEVKLSFPLLRLPSLTSTEGYLATRSSQ